EVRQHAAEPALVDVGHARALGFLGDDLARLALGADEEHRAAVGRELAQVLHRLVVLLERFLPVEDVDAVAVPVEKGRHPRVPESGLVAEVPSGLEHLPHGYGHDDLRWVGSDASALTAPGTESRVRHPRSTMRAIS